MSCKTLMVHLDLNADNDGLLKITADLARRFEARVIGIAACQPLPPIYEEGLMTAEIIAQDQAEIEKEFAAAEARFRAALTGRTAGLEWRTTIIYASLADFIAAEARAADLIITGRDIGMTMMDNTRRVNIGDLAMRAGRPLLIVPPGVSSLPLQNVFVGWKESRESRRAVADALPLLQQAGRATVLEVTAEQDTAIAESHVKDVAAWLTRHQVTAQPMAISAPRMEVGAFRDALRNGKCDLLVAGAYGHNRLGEWFFGGVTQDILLDPDFCVLISH